MLVFNWDAFALHEAQAYVDPFSNVCLDFYFTSKLQKIK